MFLNICLGKYNKKPVKIALIIKRVLCAIYTYCRIKTAKLFTLIFTSLRQFNWKMNEME
jgi:hypothetical protein